MFAPHEGRNIEIHWLESCTVIITAEKKKKKTDNVCSQKREIHRRVVRARKITSFVYTEVNSAIVKWTVEEGADFQFETRKYKSGINASFTLSQFVLHYCAS